MHPRGATDDQIIWRLRTGGLRIDASELLQGLTRLSERGEIVLDGRGRWKLAEFTKAARKTTAGDGSGPALSTSDGLRAAEAICRSAASADITDQTEAAEDGFPDWSSILAYYAATQRHDPRGQIEEFGDRHGKTWNLVRTTGRWWSGAELRVPSGAFSEDFRVALAARKTSSAALGWPVSVFHGKSGASFVPGLIVPVEWAFHGDEVVFSVDATLPALNPVWMREVRARSSWSETALQECLLPEGEELDLAAVGERMKHALATLGAAALRPGDLAGEVSTSGNGIRNAAGIFLPEDGSFTKGAAEDLETLRSWDREKRGRTALAALIAPAIDASRAPESTEAMIPLLAPNLLTPSQREAAETALAGPVTVIQGPPGTGKSQVILALLLSAVASGRTVLFAAKNHQAVDEVEKRLKEIVGDAPLLVRGRDAEGERDTSFLDALAEIAKGADWNPRNETDPGPARRALLAGAETESDLRRAAQRLQRLQVEACDLVEQLELFRKYPTESDAGEPRARAAWVRLLERFLSLFRSHATPTGALPQNPSLRQVARRLADVKAEIAARPPEGDAFAKGEELAKDLLETFPKLALRITLPDEGDRTFAAERLKEIEFEKVKSARRMKVEDAMLVLRHRPVWAISTLSVPSRVPLVPCLFDYVIFDEASQCDIASALPLLARARKAIVVGDPMQLRFVPSLGNAAEHALMDAAGLPRAGRASIAQSVNSLFDFADRRPASRRLFLADQFRSAPAIVDYLNQDFYGGKLIARREDDHFKPPSAYKPGLSWENVAGDVKFKDEGNVNKAEAARIAALVRSLAEDPGFTGSVGVISPFNSQVAEIRIAIDAAVSESACNRLKLRVATVDKWQGAETDIVFFSLVVSSGSPVSARTFLQRERRRLNVAVSRARAVCVVVGDLAFAKTCGIRHIEFLAHKATTPWSPPKLDLFDSEWERRLDTAMRARGLSPFPQFPVGTRYLDFALDPHGRKLNVEVDGRRWHTDASGNRKVGDILRDREMRARGWKVLRFWVHELANDMEACVDGIERELGEA